MRQRLLNLSHAQGEDYYLILTRYALERLLYRLSVSRYSQQFVLKGALLFSVWTGEKYRPTRDLDLLGSGEASAERLRKTFKEICLTRVKPDGITFDQAGMELEAIREDQEYQGQRIMMRANLGKARIRVQVDIGFGDIVKPAVEEIVFPTLLDFPSPKIRAYSREATIAEKLQAIVYLGLPNSRMKDFYDLYMMAKLFSFEGMILAEAIRVTFERRKTRIPKDVPLALSDEFISDRNKQRQWRAFLSKNRLETENQDLSEMVNYLRKFIMPIWSALGKDQWFRRSWSRGGPWKRKRSD